MSAFPRVIVSLRRRLTVVCFLASLRSVVCPFSLGSCPCLPISPLLAFLCWMVCLPSQGLVSPCLTDCTPFFFPFAGGCVHLPEGLVFLVSHFAASVFIFGPPMLGFGLMRDLCWAYVGPCWALEGHVGDILILC